MATALSVTLNMVLAAEFTNALDLSTPADELSLSLSDSLSNGIAIDQANCIWHDTRSLAATSESLDLSGSLTNAWGTSILFTCIKGILIHNKSIVAGENLAVGGGSNPFINWVANASDIVNIGPDGILLLWNPSAAGYAVTAGTGDILKIDSGAATLSYDIVLIGEV